MTKQEMDYCLFAVKRAIDQSEYNHFWSTALGKCLGELGFAIDNFPAPGFYKIEEPYKWTDSVKILESLPGVVRIGQTDMWRYEE